MQMKQNGRGSSALQRAVLFGLSIVIPQLAFGVPTAKTVPWVPTDASIPHDTYAGKVVTLKGTSDVFGVGNAVTYDWDFGDGSAHATGQVLAANQYAVQATHTYVGAVGTNWTAVLTITDATGSGSANYLVTMRANDLTSNVNVSIDEGLWYLHKNMQRYLVSGIPEGDWDSIAPTGCTAGDQACDSTNDSVAINASNLQAFEVNGHLESGAASNPYTETVARGLKRLFSQLAAGAISNKTINFAAPPSCPVAPCTYNPDGNGNGLAIYPESAANTNRQFYQGGQFMDAIVATGTPNAITTTGPVNVIGRTYKDVIQDMVDGYNFCQYGSSPGGAWYYSCNGFDDQSVSQWGAIGLLGAKSFGVTIPQIVLDANKVWLANSQQANGIFGYQGTAPAWGPYATTPSGMVQLAMDGVGRGTPTWDHAESYIRDNFDNSIAPCGADPSCAAITNPKSYTYGLFSFTKSMLLHAPGGVLTPITLLQSNSGSGKPPIDWYSAEVTTGATSDGIARTLVNRQNAAGYWTGHSYVSNHYPFETAWSIIMLRRSVFIACVSNLGGKGTPSGRAAARIDLTWTGINNVDHYNVLRGTANGGPYSLIGNTTITAFSDTTGLANGNTYFYVLQPFNSNGSEICQSNQASIPIPAGGR